MNVERIDALLRPSDVVLEAKPFLVLRIDASGRWISFSRGRGFSRRTLDGQVVQRRDGAVETLGPSDALRRHSEVQKVCRSLVAASGGMSPEALQCRGGTEADLVSLLRRAAGWSGERLQAERERFSACYPEPVSILPPDRYRDLVLLPACGCPNGQCTFCAFYRQSHFRVLSPAEFETHLAGVRELFGPLLEQRSGIFLGSASALSLGQPRVLEVLDRVRREFALPTRGVACFLDPDHAPIRETRAYRELSDAGLTLVVMGLETGLPSLRKSIGKSPDVDRVVQAIHAQKKAGLSCGVTVLSGVGGSACSAEHCQSTAETLRRAGLQPEDRVYLSPLLGSLPPAALLEETERLRAVLSETTAARIIPYRMERFRYYA